MPRGKKLLEYDLVFRISFFFHWKEVTGTTVCSSCSLLEILDYYSVDMMPNRVRFFNVINTASSCASVPHLFNPDGLVVSSLRSLFNVIVLNSISSEFKKCL